MVHSWVTAMLHVSSGYLFIFSIVATCTSITSVITWITTMSHQENLPALIHIVGSFLTSFLSSGCKTQTLLSIMKFARTLTCFCPMILSKKRQHRAAFTDSAKPLQDDQTSWGKTADRKLCPSFSLLICMAEGDQTHG